MYAEASPAPKPSQPQPSRRLARRPRSLPLGRRLAKHTAILEISSRLTVNGLLALVAVGSLGRLVPYIQAQAQRLEEVSQAVTVAEASTTKLRTDFDRYFDPSQASKIMQEQSGYKDPSQRQIVWTEPTQP